LKQLNTQAGMLSRMAMMIFGRMVSFVLMVIWLKNRLREKRFWG